MSAIRQYSGFDYFITFLSFLMYSLPVFWVAVLLKQYGAIEFNNFLGDPVVGWGTIITVSVVSGLIWMGALGGSGRRRLYVLIGATVVTFAVVYFILATGWLNSPSLGIVGVGLTGLAAAVVLTYLSTGLENRRALWTSLDRRGGRHRPVHAPPEPLLVRRDVLAVDDPPVRRRHRSGTGSGPLVPRSRPCGCLRAPEHSSPSS